MTHYVWKDGECFCCGETFRGLVSENPSLNLCPSCRPAPDIDHIKSVQIHTFDPYYDRSLGVEFSSRREKNKYIKDNGFVDITDIKHIDDYPKPDDRKPMPKEFEQVYCEVMQGAE